MYPVRQRQFVSSEMAYILPVLTRCKLVNALGVAIALVPLEGHAL